tara:strand:+ start:265 stop:915 length:651 start_codon:yes stop_codon:yes gene_type:complete
MAIISSYPVSIPNLVDQVLGSNTYDSTGTAVQGNPTVQYTFTSIKTLVDQQMVQQLVATSQTNATAPLIASQGPTATNNVYTILFGAAQTPTLNHVKIDAVGKVTFVSTGTYYIKQEYYIGATLASKPVLLFRTFKDELTQEGETTMFNLTSNGSNDRNRLVIENIVNITSGGTIYEFQMVRDAAGANDGTLFKTLNNNAGFEDVPNASLTISKLV